MIEKTGLDEEAYNELLEARKINERYRPSEYIKRNQTKLFINHAIKYGKLTKQLAVAIVINNKPKIIELT